MILEQLADRVSAAIWNLHPGWAVAAGKHEYDGQVPDLSAGAIEAGLERLGRLEGQLAGVSELGAEEQVERDLLLAVLARERFEGEQALRWRRDPAWYLDALDPAVYLERDYAPGGLRLERAAAILGEAGAVLGRARENLAPVVPRVWAEHAATRARRLARRLAAQSAWVPESREVPAEAAWLREAAAGASTELEAYAAWLEAERLPGASDQFALGAAGLTEWLRAAERLDWTPGDLAAAAAALTKEDRARFAGAPERGAPARHGTDRVAALETAVGAARDFVSGGSLVSVPSGAVVRVAAGPASAGRGPGWLQPAGAYDDPATVGVLYVTPEPASEAPGVLDDLAIGAAFPGRLLAVRAAGGSRGPARRRFPSGGFVAGWALLAGEVMLEAGYDGADGEWRRSWQRRALLADCRMRCVAGLHAAGMTLEEAAAALRQETGLDEAAAWEEAVRCAVDPGRAAAGLGRAILRRLRARPENGSGRPPAPGSLDRLLSAAALPLGMLDRLLVS